MQRQMLKSTIHRATITDWDVDYEHAVQARTSTVRGWEQLPVLAS